MEYQTATPLVATWSYYYLIDRCAEAEVAVSMRCCSRSGGGFECQQTAVEALRLGAWRLALRTPTSTLQRGGTLVTIMDNFNSVNSLRKSSLSQLCIMIRFSSTVVNGTGCNNSEANGGRDALISRRAR
jgi:hypothetical protein